MGKSTNRLGLWQADRPSEPLETEKGSRWRIQVYSPGKSIADWKATGSPTEWYSVHPYTAIAQALVGDVARPPLRLRPEQIVLIMNSDSSIICWLTAIDIVVIAEEVNIAASMIGGE